MLDESQYRELVDKALKEDLGQDGDITSAAIIDAQQAAMAEIVAKEPGVICGCDIFRRVYSILDEELEVEFFIADGERACAQAIIGRIQGAACSILAGERTALNFLQHLSGIASMTDKFVAACQGTKAVILDTRKTIPGLRALEKYAVHTGGGTNHRFGLYDAILIKDNHITVCGSVTEAIWRARTNAGHHLPIEVEVSSLTELAFAAESDVDIIMLDNFNIEDIREAAGIAGDKALLEVSGGVTLDNVREIALTGVDRISVGALTQSAPALDISLDLIVSP